MFSLPQVHRNSVHRLSIYGHQRAECRKTVIWISPRGVYEPLLGNMSGDIHAAAALRRYLRDLDLCFVLCSFIERSKDSCTTSGWIQRSIGRNNSYSRELLLQLDGIHGYCFIEMGDAGKKYYEKASRLIERPSHCLVTGAVL